MLSLFTGGGSVAEAAMAVCLSRQVQAWLACRVCEGADWWLGSTGMLRAGSKQKALVAVHPRGMVESRCVVE